jgi:ribosome-associated protein
MMNEKTAAKVLNAVSQAIFDKKGMNILALDLRSCRLIPQYAIIAEGAADRHVIAISTSVKEVMRDLGFEPMYTQGMQVGDWIVLDYTDIVVHIFMPGMRDKYRLENLWKDSDIVDLSIDVFHKNSIAGAS